MHMINKRLLVGNADDAKNPPPQVSAVLMVAEEQNVTVPARIIYAQFSSKKSRVILSSKRQYDALSPTLNRCNPGLTVPFDGRQTLSNDIVATDPEILYRRPNHSVTQLTRRDFRFRQFRQRSSFQGSRKLLP